MKIIQVFFTLVLLAMTCLGSTSVHAQSETTLAECPTEPNGWEEETFEVPEGTRLCRYVDTFLSLVEAESVKLEAEAACTELAGASISFSSVGVVSGLPAVSVYCEILPVSIGNWGDFTNGSLIRACNTDCTKDVRQTRECIGGEVGNPNCIGETSRVVEQSCSPGEGMCPTIGVWTEFVDDEVVRACDASCTQDVRQVRTCEGGEVGNPNCIGDTTQIVERACEPGQGMCPFNAETVGMITENPLIEDDSPEESVGTALENLCPQLGFGNQSLTAAQQDLVNRCNDIIFEEDDQTQLDGVQNIIADEISAQAVNLRRVNLAQLGNIASRLAALRPALSQSNRALSLDGELRHPLPGYAGVSPAERMYWAEQAKLHPDSAFLRGGAAGDDEVAESDGRWGIFVSGLYGRGDRARTRRAGAFDFDNYNITLGADYLLNQSTIVGAAIGYGASDTSFSGNGGTLENDTNTLSFYGTHYFQNNLVLDGAIGYGSSEYISRRNLNYTADGVRVEQTAESRPDGDQLLFSLGLGKSISTGQAFDWDFSARVNYLDATIDRFAEFTLNTAAPGFGLALEIDEQEVTSLTSEFNIQLSKAFSRSFGVVIPSFGLTWLHEFEDGSDFLRARFVNDPFSVNFVQSGLGSQSGVLPTIFQIPLDENDSDYGRAQLGVNLLFPRNWSVNFLINTTLGLENLDYEYYSLGVRKGF